MDPLPETPAESSSGAGYPVGWTPDAVTALAEDAARRLVPAVAATCARLNFAADHAVFRVAVEGATASAARVTGRGVWKVSGPLLGAEIAAAVSKSPCLSAWLDDPSPTALYLVVEIFHEGEVLGRRAFKTLGVIAPTRVSFEVAAGPPCGAGGCACCGGPVGT